MNSSVTFLRRIALLEAISYLLLLGIAMPLKYIWQQPLGVKYVGAIHGGLFVIFCLALFLVWRNARWPLPRLIGIFIASFIPILPFFLDARMKAWEAEPKAA
jgi:integral membrane protein